MGFVALMALGLVSAAVYALAVPIASSLGKEPLACHPAVVAALFLLYLGALWLVGRRLASTSRVVAVILGFAVLIKVYPAILMAAWWRGCDWRFPAAVGAAVALGYLPYVATLGVGTVGFLPSYFLDRREEFNLGLRALLTWGIGFSAEVPRRLTIVLLLVAVAAALAVRPT